MIFQKAIGKKGEDLATKKYRKMGYKILVRNFSCRMGELDIVAQKGDIVAIIEVKTRKNDNFGQAKEFVDYHKQQRIKSTAMIYVNKNNLGDYVIRFDVVEVYTETSVVNIIENAF